MGTGTAPGDYPAELDPLNPVNARRAALNPLLPVRWACLLRATILVVCCASRLHAQLIATDLDGRAVSLAPRTNQLAVVIVFLSTDCPVANRCLPELRALAARYEDRIPFFHVYPNPQDSPDQIRKHRAEYNLSADAYRDPEHTLARRLGAHRTPEVIVLAADGARIYQGRVNDQFSSIGVGRPEATRHDLADVLQRVLSGDAPRDLIQPAVGCSFRALE